LPSTRAIPDRGVFYVAFPKRSIPSRDVFYIADPISSIRADRFLRFFDRGFHAS
jgi:hypothetical protein